MKRRSAVVGAAVLALLLAACSSNQQAGAAAVIGKTRITEQRLSTLVTDAQATERKLKKPVTPVAQASASALNWQIRMVIVDIAAKEAKITASKTEVEELVNSAYKQYGKDSVLGQLASNGFSEAEIPTYARLTVLQSKISKAILQGQSDQAAQTRLASYWQSLSKSLKIQVAPRYGKWNSETLVLDPPKSEVSTPSGSPQQ